MSCSANVRSFVTYARRSTSASSRSPSRRTSHPFGSAVAAWRPGWWTGPSRSTRTSRPFARTGTCCSSAGPFPSWKSCSRSDWPCCGPRAARSRAASAPPERTQTSRPTSPVAPSDGRRGLLLCPSCLLLCPSSDDLAADDTRPAHQPSFDHALQPPPGDRPGERQDEEEAHEVGQEPRGQQQSPTNQNESRVSQLTAGHLAGVERHPQGPPGARPLLLDQIGTEGGLRQQQRQRLPATDHRAHCDDHCDLGHRHHQQSEEDIPPPSGASTTVTGHTSSRCHRGSLLKSDRTWPSRYRA